MKHTFWTAYSNKNRILTISEIEKMVSVYGYITDFKQYSDISIMIKIEIEELKIDNLYNDLSKYINLDNIEQLSSSSNKERIIYLNITFTTGTGDVRIEVPAIPG